MHNSRKGLTPGIPLGLGLAAAVNAMGCRLAKQSVWQMLFRAHLSQKPGSMEEVLGDGQVLEAVTRLRTLIRTRDSYPYKGQHSSDSCTQERLFLFKPTKSTISSILYMDSGFPPHFHFFHHQPFGSLVCPTLFIVPLSVWVGEAAVPPSGI